MILYIVYFNVYNDMAHFLVNNSLGQIYCRNVKLQSCECTITILLF